MMMMMMMMMILDDVFFSGRSRTKGFLCLVSPKSRFWFLRFCFAGRLPASVCVLFKWLGLGADRGFNVLFPSLACRIARIVAIALREDFARRQERRTDADSEGFHKPAVRVPCRDGRWSVLDAWRWRRQAHINILEMQDSRVVALSAVSCKCLSLVVELWYCWAAHGLPLRASGYRGYSPGPTDVP